MSKSKVKTKETVVTFKIKKGDMVKVRAGKDKGKQGKVIQVFPRLGKVVVEGVNINKKHLRPQRQGEAGQIIEFAAPLAVSKVQIVCPQCGKVTRVGFKINEDKKKVRICRKCKASL